MNEKTKIQELEKKRENPKEKKIILGRNLGSQQLRTKSGEVYDFSSLKKIEERGKVILFKGVISHASKTITLPINALDRGSVHFLQGLRKNLPKQNKEEKLEVEKSSRLPFTEETYPLHLNSILKELPILTKHDMKAFLAGIRESAVQEISKTLLSDSNTEGLSLLIKGHFNNSFQEALLNALREYHEKLSHQFSEQKTRLYTKIENCEQIIRQHQLSIETKQARIEVLQEQGNSTDKKIHGKQKEEQKEKQKEKQKEYKSSFSKSSVRQRLRKLPKYQESLLYKHKAQMEQERIIFDKSNKARQQKQHEDSLKTPLREIRTEISKRREEIKVLEGEITPLMGDIRVLKRKAREQRRDHAIVNAEVMEKKRTMKKAKESSLADLYSHWLQVVNESNIVEMHGFYQSLLDDFPESMLALKKYLHELFPKNYRGHEKVFLEKSIAEQKIPISSSEQFILTLFVQQVHPYDPFKDDDEKEQERKEKEDSEKKEVKKEQEQEKERKKKKEDHDKSKEIRNGNLLGFSNTYHDYFMANKTKALKIEWSNPAPSVPLDTNILRDESSWRKITDAFWEAAFTKIFQFPSFLPFPRKYQWLLLFLLHQHLQDINEGNRDIDTSEKNLEEQEKEKGIPFFKLPFLKAGLEIEDFEQEKKFLFSGIQSMYRTIQEEITEKLISIKKERELQLIPLLHEANLTKVLQENKKLSLTVESIENNLRQHYEEHLRELPQDEMNSPIISELRNNYHDYLRENRFRTSRKITSHIKELLPDMLRYSKKLSQTVDELLPLLLEKRITKKALEARLTKSFNQIGAPLKYYRYRILFKEMFFQQLMERIKSPLEKDKITELLISWRFLPRLKKNEIRGMTSISEQNTADHVKRIQVNVKENRFIDGSIKAFAAVKQELGEDDEKSLAILMDEARGQDQIHRYRYIEIPLHLYNPYLLWSDNGLQNTDIILGIREILPR